MASATLNAAEKESQEEAQIAGQFLTFILSGEEYGVQILRVQEIKGWNNATIIPNVPEYILGVINLRGEIVPIMDMRRRFKLDETPFGPTTVVIVVKVTNVDKTQTVGLVVDAVSEVYRIEGSNIQPPPDFGGVISSEFVQGLATVDEKMIILLEVDHLIDFEAIRSVPE